MEVIETVQLSKTTPEKFEKLRQIWSEHLDKGEMPEYITTTQDIEAMICLLHYLQYKEKVIVDPLKKLGIVHETVKEVLTPFEKSIHSIARSDYIKKLLHNRNEDQKKLRGNSLRPYLSYIVPKEREIAGYAIAKRIYDSHMVTLRTRVNRVKKSPKVQELTERYPDVDVQSIVAVSVIQDKIQLVHDDLDWIEQIIVLIAPPVK